MKRGEIWTVAGGQATRGNLGPRSSSRTITSTPPFRSPSAPTDPTEAPLFRLLIEPAEGNGLHAQSRLMVDKITTVPKAKLGSRLGQLSDEDIVRLNQAIVVFLGLAASPRSVR